MCSKTAEDLAKSPFQKRFYRDVSNGPGYVSCFFLTSFRFGRRTGRISRVWLASSWSYCHLTSIDRYIDQCQVFSNAHAIRSERKDLSVYQTAIDISHGMGIDKCREETMEAYTAYIAKMHIHELAKEVLPTTYNYEKWLWGQFRQ